MLRFNLIILIFMLGCMFCYAGERKLLTVGLLPYLNTSKLISDYLPLKKHLEKTLGHKVKLTTAPNFLSFLQRANKGEYDIYFTAPHFAAIAEHSGQYNRLVVFKRQLYGAVVVRKDSDIDGINALMNKTLTTPDPLAIVTMLGEQMLLDSGLTINKNVVVNHTLSHNTALIAVVRGKSDAAVASAATFESVKKRFNNIRVLSQTPKIPHAMFMANAQLGEELIVAIKDVMIRFENSEEGKTFFANKNYSGFREITDADMKVLEPYVKLLNAKLKGVYN